jgi:uncharacterized membrane protein YgdD (TMEM256/DUF423 family)
MNNSFLKVAALLGALSVALGAFGAHQLRATVPAETLAAFETGVRYQFYHALALFGVALLSERIKGKWIRYAGNSFITGIVLFSGSLYALTALKAAKAGSLGLVGILTPIGGLFLIAGWLFLFAGVLKKN